MSNNNLIVVIITDLFSHLLSIVKTGNEYLRNVLLFVILFHYNLFVSTLMRSNIDVFSYTLYLVQYKCFVGRFMLGKCHTW